jgi:glycosyltransferase involved in cell wall biosynthesis
MSMSLLAAADSRDPTYPILNRSEKPLATTRVLHLVSSGGLYGAEQVILNLARAEDTISFVGALYNAHSPNIEVIDEAEKRGLRTVVFDSQGRVDFRTIIQIKRFLREHRIDILHSHGYKPDIIGFLATLSGGTRWVATNHVWHPISGKLRLYEGLDAFVLRFAGRTVAVSSEIRQELISTRVPAANIRVIENGIDIDPFAQSRSAATLKEVLGMREHDVVVTIVGRLSPEKGHRTFLLAAKRVSSKNSNIKFLIVGDGPMAEELRSETIKLDLKDCVVFAGFRRDMPAIYALSDVLVNASTIEGLPITILEAMASRVPVIASRAGGIPDVITDNETGLLIDAHDVDALERSIERLIDNPTERQRLAAAAFELVTTKYSFRRMCDAYRRVYREVLNGN